MVAVLVAALCLVQAAGRRAAWNNFAKSYVWEPPADDPTATFQPEIMPMEEDSGAGMEGAVVSIGEDHACAIEAVEDASVGGELVCWHTGRDKHGLLNPPSGIFVQVSAGKRHTCAIRSDERLICWGSDWADRAPDGQFLQVSSGGNHACAIRQDGAVRCFGMCAFGECDAPDGAFLQVSCSGHASCGVRANGTVACWGMGSNGPRGLARTPAGVQFTQVSVSTSRTACGVTLSAEMVCWGSIVAHPDDGQLYVREGTYALVSSGHNIYCGLTASSTISCDGNVFHLSRDATYTPDRQTPWQEITTRHGTVCGVELDAPHTVRCWGGRIADAMPENAIHAAV